ncbi:MAG: hypothetical protein LBU47_06800, partial [Christensenellaceae bacterium]|nr:hypothetical protein [Christensenellaceae bacterium]
RKRPRGLLGSLAPPPFLRKGPFLIAGGTAHPRRRHRGALLLIDGRYGQPPYPDLLPPNWEPLLVDGPAAIESAFEGSREA